MDANSNNNSTRSDPEQQETRYLSYILRIWKADDGTFKGYVLNPLTNQTYPVVNITQAISSVDPPVSGGSALEPIGCRLGVWDPEAEGKESD